MIRAKLTLHILPVVTILFILSFLDRVNLSFAAIHMNRDLGFGPAVYGFGAGIFFLGYLIFEIPGARLVERRSARVWLGIMLIAWGAAATAMGAVRGVPDFYVLRVLLGVAEAGFFPGIIVYLSHWFPPTDRARAIGALAVGLPAANLLGAPLSGLLLSQNWLSVPGWRWLFILEGLPSVVAGVATIAWLDERPRDAVWLTAQEKEWLESALSVQDTRRAPPRRTHQPRAFNIRLMMLVLIWFLDNMGVYGFNLWLPMLMKKLSGYSSTTVVLLSSAPFVGALAAAAYVSLSSDRSGERRWHTSLPMLTFGVGLALSVLFSNRLGLAIASLCLAGLGLTSGTPSFWALAMGSAETAGSTRVAIITSAGALGGFCGPYVMGYLRQATGSFGAGLVVLSCSVIAAGTLAVWCVKSGDGKRLDRAA